MWETIKLLQRLQQPYMCGSPKQVSEHEELKEYGKGEHTLFRQQTVVKSVG